MNPTSVRRALYGHMAGDSTLTSLLASPPVGYSKAIFYEQAPQGAAFPYIIFAKSSGNPTYANATKPAFETDVWLIKGVDRGTSADKAEAISARLQDLLNDASVSISGGTAVWLRRQSDVDYPEDSEGVRYVHSGSLYRLVVEPT